LQSRRPPRRVVDALVAVYSRDAHPAQLMPLTPEDYAQKLNEWARDTMIAAHGTRFVAAGNGRARAELDFTRSLTQLTGVFHAGAIIALADEAATAAAMWETNPSGEFRPELFPLTVQLSVNLLRNADHGTLTADARIVHRGRTMFVVDVEVTDGDARVVARLVATQLVPRKPGQEGTSRS
jgi:1,4-dihydroxy-2-naphthoyl-CoA hydrolase